MYNSEQQLAEDFKKDFPNLNAKQLWTLTKFAKRVRLRARNNAAFNNLCNRLFEYADAKFEQVTKVNKRNEQYPGLKITVNEESISEDEDES